MTKIALIFLILTTNLMYQDNKQQTETLFLKIQALKNSLVINWGIDSNTSNVICDKFKPLLDDSSLHPVIDDFIKKSQQLNLDFSLKTPLIPLHPEDGLVQAPQQHLVVFENPWIRVLGGSTQPGKQEKLHLHMWKSLMIVIKPTPCNIIYANGTTEILDWPIGVYELPAMEHYSCTNIGTTADEYLRFEIKNN